MIRKPAKPKPCAFSKCRRTFTPRRPMQRTCETVKCSIGYAREREAKKQRRESRAWTRVQREALKTKPMLLKEAQAAFNAYIRLRDAGLPCISCNRLHDRQPFTGSFWHAGHYRSVGACPELRFHEDNCHRQCASCNKHKSGNVVEYRINLIKRIGLPLVEILEGKHPMPQLSRDDVRAIRDLYRAKAADLRRARKAA